MGKVDMVSYDYGSDVIFEPLIDTLREESCDKTPLTDNYVSFYRNVYDMISVLDDTSNDPNYIIDVNYNIKNKSLLIKYKKGDVKEIKLEDNYLFNATYNHDNGIASFVLTNGDLIRLDLNKIKDAYYSKLEIDKKINFLEQKIDNKVNLKWGKY